MSAADIVTAAMGAFGTAASIVLGYIVYRGSDRASERTTQVQNQANSTTGFQALTQEQRIELTDLRKRVQESEQSARDSQEAARQAKIAAEDAQEIASECHSQQEKMMTGYRALWAWAQEPCPHDTPPPRPIWL